MSEYTCRIAVTAPIDTIDWLRLQTGFTTRAALVDTLIEAAVRDPDLLAQFRRHTPLGKVLDVPPPPPSGRASIG